MFLFELDVGLQPGPIIIYHLMGDYSILEASKSLQPYLRYKLF